MDPRVYGSNAGAPLQRPPVRLDASGTKRLYTRRVDGGMTPHLEMTPVGAQYDSRIAMARNVPMNGPPLHQQSPGPHFPLTPLQQPLYSSTPGRNTPTSRSPPPRRVSALVSTPGIPPQSTPYSTGNTTPAPTDSSDVRSAVHAHLRSHRDKYAHESIDVPNYLDTPWIPPSRERAIEEARRSKFSNGKAPLCISVPDMDTMGVAIALYFRLMRYLTVLFFLMSVVAIPALWICRVGTRVAKEDEDPLKLSIWSLGNVNIQGNTTVGPRTFTPPQAAYVVALSDLGYSILFLLFIFFWKYKVRAVSNAINDDVLQLSDYSVMVKHLPRNATARDVFEHFNNLYDLSKEDWTFNGFCCCFRQKHKKRQFIVNNASAVNHQQQTLQQAAASGRTLSARLQAAAASRFRHTTETVQSLRENAPVGDVSNTGNEMYRDSWIAEVVIVHPLGNMIRKFQTQQRRLAEIRIQKAIMKRCNPPNPNIKPSRKFRNAASHLARLQADFDKFDKRHMDKLTADECVGAFVVFNCEDSRRYCLEDYARSTSQFGRKTQETPLRFGPRQHPIMVVPAPEPSDLIWENIEMPASARMWRQLFTYFSMVLLLVGSIIILAVAQHYKTIFQADVPSSTVCNTVLPQNAYFPATPPSDTLLYHEKSQDSLCDAGQFYINYISATDGELDPLKDWGCAIVPGRLSQRCVSIHDTEPCSTINPNGTAVHFQMQNIPGCFCLQALTTYVDKYGVFGGVIKLKNDESSLCFAFAEQYVVAQALMISAAALVVVINAALKAVLTWATEFERHETHTNFQRSVSIKVFLAQFVNTGLIVLIVNVKVPFHMPAGIGLFTGQFSSFNARWNAVVGTTIMITMLLNIATPHFPMIFDRLWSCFLRRKKAFRELLTQEQADALYKPETFNPSNRVPILLNTVFITLAYSSALPLLLPFAFLALFVMYWVEKITLLRFYAKPPKMNENFAHMVSSLLPWALLIHLLFSVWMYGTPDGLASNPVDLYKPAWTKAYNDGLTYFSKYDRINLTPKLRRQIVFPNAAMFVVIVVVRLLWSYVFAPLASLLLRVLYLALCCCLCDRRREKPKRHNPRFTATFAIRLEPGDPWVPSPEAIELGLRLVDDNTRGDKCKVVVKVWTSDGVFHGIPHRKEQPKLTWQVIAERFIVSYDMVANPDYTAIRAHMADVVDRLAREQAAILSHITTTDRTGRTTPVETPVTQYEGERHYSVRQDSVVLEGADETKGEPVRTNFRTALTPRSGSYQVPPMQVQPPRNDHYNSDGGGVPNLVISDDGRTMEEVVISPGGSQYRIEYHNAGGPQGNYSRPSQYGGPSPSAV